MGILRSAGSAILVSLVVVAGLAAVPAACSSDEPQTYSGYRVDPPLEVGDQSLPLADGSGEMTFAADPGDLDIVYFGYTYCPDVCPTTMSDLKRVVQDLPGEDAARLSVVMATVDPARDTPEVLTSYIGNFFGDGIAVRTDDDAALRAVTDAFGASYRVQTDDQGEIEVSHTPYVYAVDDSGTVVMQWPFGTSAESFAEDLGSLLAETQQP